MVGGRFVRDYRQVKPRLASWGVHRIARNIVSQSACSGSVVSNPSTLLNAGRQKHGPIDLADSVAGTGGTVLKYPLLIYSRRKTGGIHGYEWVRGSR
jgi:hypothetical protein